VAVSIRFMADALMTQTRPLADGPGHRRRRSGGVLDVEAVALDRATASGKNEPMNPEQAMATLCAHKLALKAAAVVRLSLFGSTARGDHRPDSDVDLLAAFDQTRSISLLDMAGIEIQLSELLQIRVLDL
jgi:uncharacterized protein